MPFEGTSPVGHLRCDICAELSKARDIMPCESCGQLCCQNCSAPYLATTTYVYCEFCLLSGDEEEDEARFE